jgi:hypothetical protein
VSEESIGSYHTPKSLRKSHSSLHEGSFISSIPSTLPNYSQSSKAVRRSHSLHENNYLSSSISNKSGINQPDGVSQALSLSRHSSNKSLIQTDTNIPSGLSPSSRQSSTRSIRKSSS